MKELPDEKLGDGVKPDFNIAIESYLNYQDLIMEFAKKMLHITEKVITLLAQYKIMEISIIKIGNSKGLRLSKTVLEKYNIKDKMEMILGKGQIILKPIDNPRKDWEKAFKEMRQNGDDKLLLNDVFEDENLEEWN